ncbi:MAG: choice-of-anchor L domain-containing protein [Bacteroidia bacterium]
MKTKITFAFILSIFLNGICLNSSAQLVVTGGGAVTPAQLVNTILGGGVIATNITYTGATNARGTFTATSTNIGMTNGIMMSSGDVTSAAGANAPASVFHSSAMNNNSDPQLLAIVAPGQTIHDACILEFDFSVASDSVHFNYVFGSEEYNDWVNTSFNDVFGFFINGPGLPANKNIAIVPGTVNTPVSINNINNGGPYGGVSSGPCTNCAYFVDNINGNTIFLDAFTTLLEAKSVVSPCETYHIKLAISDVSDQVFDSDVFIKGGSFSSVGQIGIFANGVPQQNNDTVYGCPGGTVTLSLNPAGNYTWSTGGTTQSIVVPVPAVGAPLVQYSGFVTNPPFYSCFAYTTTLWVAPAPPTATITGNNSICAGGNTVLAANAGNVFLWSTGATTQNINVSTAGTYTVTVTNGPGCVATSAPFVVTVGPASASITGPTAICSGAAASLQANAGTNYLWSNGQTIQNISVTITGTYTVTVTQPGGCTASASQTINLSASPTPAITGINSVCAGILTSFDAGVDVTGPYSIYSWSTGASTQTITPLSAGIYTVTVTNASGCTGTATLQLTINPLPTPVINGITSICQGSATNLDAGVYSSYSWTGGSTSQVLNVSASGTYTVTVTNAAGCTGTTSKTVTVNANPTPVIAGPNSICGGSTTVYDGGPGFVGYSWSNGFTSQTITIGATGTYTVTVTDASGCTGTVSKNLTVNPNPLPVVTGINSICQGSNTTFDAGIFASYNWSNGSSTQTISINTPGPYTVTVTDLNGCTGSAVLNLTVNANPTPVITGTTSICSGTSTVIDGGAGYSGYQWTGGFNTQTINVSITGAYTVTVTDGNGCTASVSQQVNVNALPTPNITGITAVCQGASANLDAGGPYSIYNWSTGAGSQIINPSTGGIYTVTVTDVNGCTGSTTVNVVVSNNPSPLITGINVICQGTPTTFDAGGPYSIYNWSNGASTQTINPPSAGTYTVTVTDGNGCIGTANYNLTVNALPTPIITGVSSICQGTATAFDAGGGYMNYQWSTGGNTQTVNLNTSGTYTVTVTDANGCTNSTNNILTVNALPTPVIAGANSICAGTTTNLDAGLGYSIYQWSNGANGQVINTGVSGTYTVTVTDLIGCTGSANINLAVNPNPTPSINGVNVICQGTPTTFDAGGPYSIYNWSTGANTQAINPTNAGTYTVTVTDGNGCTGTANYSLTVNALPTPVIAGVNSICQGTATTFDAGGGYINYQWSTGGNTQTVNLNASGTYTVTVTDANGCTNSTNNVLTVNALPTPSISGANSICAGTTTNLDAGLGYSIYQWSNGANGQVINTGVSGPYTVTVTDVNGCTGSTNINLTVNANPTPSINGVNVICQGTPTTFDAGLGYSQYAWSSGANSQTINPTATGTYTVTVTDLNNCTGTASYDLLVNPLPTPVITGVNSICQGAATTFDAGSGYTNYQWSTGANSQSVNLNTSGTYTVTVTDLNGCINSTNYMLTVNALPTPAITGVNSICAGTSTNFDAGSYVSYQWSNGNNSQILNSGNAGTYTVTVTDNNGCTGSATVELKVNALPTPSIIGNDTICDGFNSVIDVGAGYTGYQWSNGATSQTINVTIAGTYSVVITDINGCTGSAAFKLEVLTAEAVIAANGPLSFCDGGDVTLTANAGLSYHWSNGASTQNILVDTTGTYMVTVINNNGCSASSAAVNVVSHPYPVVRFSNDTTTICGALRVNFFNLSTFEPGSDFKWEFGDGTASAIASPTHDYNTPGQYYVILTITSPYGCEEDSSDNIEVDFPPEAIPLFTMSSNLSPLFDAKIDFIDQSQNAYSWFWSFGDGDTSTEKNPSHYYGTAGDYTVKLMVTNQAGCNKEHSDHLTIAPFWIPNAFTPNGDGKNDLFFTSNYILDVMSFEMVIRNRWGQVVYDTKEFTKPWDGRGNDESISQEGVYVYDIYVKTKTGKEYNFKGTIDLIR